ncbi:MAG: YezD family protein [Clostridia bacterium]|nr:YezD family protein [Clostridia bacterium]
MAEPCVRNGTILTDAQLQKIREAVKDIRYGTVTLVIQDGRLIQIDRSEKIRLKTEQ